MQVDSPDAADDTAGATLNNIAQVITGPIFKRFDHLSMIGDVAAFGIESEQAQQSNPSEIPQHQPLLASR